MNENSGYFNADQLDHMRALDTLTPEEKCYCGWYPLGHCPHCPKGKTCADKLRDRNNAAPSSVCACNDGAKS